MMDFGWEENSRYNSRKQNAQSSLFPLTHPIRYEPLAKQTRFLSTAKVNFTHFVSHELSTECPVTHNKLQQSPLDLQLSADEFINHVQKLSKNGNGWNCIGPIYFTLSLDRSSNAEDLKLSLASGGDSDRNCFVKNNFSSSYNVIDLEEGTTRNFFRKKSFSSHDVTNSEEGTARSFFRKKIFSSSHNVIDLEEGTRKKTFSSSHNVTDLEEPVDRISGYAKSGRSLDSFLEICPKVRHESKDFAIPKPFLPTSLKEIPSLDIAESNYFQEYSECCQEQTSSSKGVRDKHDGFPSESKKQQLVSFQGLFDLNKPHQDDFSCCSDDLMRAYPLPESSEGDHDGLNGSMEDGTCPAVFRKKEVLRCPNETSGMFKQYKTVNLDLLDLNRNMMKEEIWTQNSENNSASGSVVTLANSESTHSIPAGTPDHKNNSTERRKQEVSCEKSVENQFFSCSQNSQEEGNKSPTSRTSCISDNDSSSRKTLNSGLTSDVSNRCIKTHLRSQIAELVRDEHGKRTSGRNDSENEFYDSKEKSSEAEFLVQQAAESLVLMSSLHSACGQDSNVKMESNETEKHKEKPQYPIDSFELNTLNLTESSLDDDSVSSKPLEVNNTNEKDFGIKLRRGRRMKDFQKEILPSLASLSRHEILEDINIIEGALRSREYRKNRAKMEICGEKWSAPLRRRRSRVNYGGRRNYS